MKILLTGAEGMLGRTLQNYLFYDPNDTHTVYGLTHKDLDITKKDQVKYAIKYYRPEAVINCAALTNLDYCEKNPDLAYEVNSIGPKLLAKECVNRNCFLIHVSTDYVYSGRELFPRFENSNPEGKPVNVYGRSKLEGETLILSAYSDTGIPFLILRTAWLYGNGGRGFVYAMRKLANENSQKPVLVVNDQVGNPTCVDDFCRVLVSCLDDGHVASGIRHVVSSDKCSRYELAKEIFKLCDSSRKVLKCKTKELQLDATLVAERPADTSLVSSNMFCHLPSWKYQLKQFFRRYNYAQGVN